jgi:hypothetical protein
MEPPSGAPRGVHDLQRAHWRKRPRPRNIRPTVVGSAHIPGTEWQALAAAAHGEVFRAASATGSLWQPWKTGPYRTGPGPAWGLPELRLLLGGPEGPELALGSSLDPVYPLPRVPGAQAPRPPFPAAAALIARWLQSPTLSAAWHGPLLRQGRPSKRQVPVLARLVACLPRSFDLRLGASAAQVAPRAGHRMSACASRAASTREGGPLS